MNSKEAKFCKDLWDNVLRANEVTSLALAAVARDLADVQAKAVDKRLALEDETNA